MTAFIIVALVLAIFAAIATWIDFSKGD